MTVGNHRQRGGEACPQCMLPIVFENDPLCEEEGIVLVLRAVRALPLQAPTAFVFAVAYFTPA